MRDPQPTVLLVFLSFLCQILGQAKVCDLDHLLVLGQEKILQFDVAVAEAVRRVAYMINVPHAFTPEYPCDAPEPPACKVPVILNAYDSYMFGENAFDLVVDVSEAFKLMVEMSWCHQSQVTEWLPWVGRHDMDYPKSIDEWRVTLERRYAKRNAELGLGDQPMACLLYTSDAADE